MRITWSRSLLIALIATVGNADTTSVRAAEKANRDNYWYSAEGQRVSTVSMLQRSPGPGADVVADRLLSSFEATALGVTTQGPRRRTVAPDSSVITVEGDRGWILTVSEDGTSAQYRNHAYDDGTDGIGVPSSARISAETLDALGRQFVETALREFVPLLQDERLESYRIVYETASQATADREVAPTDNVRFYKVALTRKLGGVPIHGPGSKVSVTLAADRTPVGFEFDWPEYSRTGVEQPVVDLEEIQRRLVSFLAAEGSSDDARMEVASCGYFDAGLDAGGSRRTVESACVVRLLRDGREDDTRQSVGPAISEAAADGWFTIPAGVTVATDLETVITDEGHGLDTNERREVSSLISSAESVGDGPGKTGGSLAAAPASTPPLMVYEHRYQGGQSASFYRTDGNLVNNMWPNVASLNNAISSIWVAPGYDATLCADEWFGGLCKTFAESPPNSSYPMVTAGLDEVVSSIEIDRNVPLWSSYSYLSNHPNARENSLSEQLQGLTHDATNWYISRKWSIWKVRLSDNLSYTSNYTTHVHRPSGCDGDDGHIGDIEYYNGYIYAPLEKCDGGDARIYVYNTSVVDTNDHFGQVKWANLGSQYKAPWVALHDGRMYSSNFNDNTIKVYDAGFAGGTTIYRLYQMALPRTFHCIQGGVINDAYLYMTTDGDSDCSGERAGIHVFKLRGRTAQYVKFIGPNGFVEGYGEEVEGITWWDIDGRYAPGIEGGQIHWILLDVDAGDDDFYLKHIRVSQ